MTVSTSPLRGRIGNETAIRSMALNGTRLALPQSFSARVCGAVTSMTV